MSELEAENLALRNALKLALRCYRYQVKWHYMKAGDKAFRRALHADPNYQAARAPLIQQFPEKELRAGKRVPGLEAEV